MAVAEDAKPSAEDVSELQRRLQEQEKALEALRKEVEALQGRSGMPAPAGEAGQTPAPSPTAKKSYQTVGAAGPWPP